MALAGVGAVSKNDIQQVTEAFIDAGSINSLNGSVHVAALDGAAIIAKAIGGNIAVGVALGIGGSVTATITQVQSENTIGHHVLSHIDNASVRADKGDIVVEAATLPESSIIATGAAASVAVAVSSIVGVSISGGGAIVNNTVTGEVVADVGEGSEISGKEPGACCRDRQRYDPVGGGRRGVGDRRRAIRGRRLDGFFGNRQHDDRHRAGLHRRIGGCCRRRSGDHCHVGLERQCAGGGDLGGGCYRVGRGACGCGQFRDEGGDITAAGDAYFHAIVEASATPHALAASLVPIDKSDGAKVSPTYGVEFQEALVVAGGKNVISALLNERQVPDRIATLAMAERAANFIKVDPTEINSPSLVSVTEGNTAVQVISAGNPAGDAMTYSIVRGDDGYLFTIDSSTGQLRFITAPDFESPLDTDKDNVYLVTVKAESSVTGAVGTKLVKVTVNDGLNIRLLPGIQRLADDVPALGSIELAEVQTLAAAAAGR